MLKPYKQPIGIIRSGAEKFTESLLSDFSFAKTKKWIMDFSKIIYINNTTIKKNWGPYKFGGSGP